MTIQLGYGDYLRFRDLISAHSGLNFSEKKRKDLEIGLRTALENAPHHITQLDAYYQFLTGTTPQSRAEMQRLINLLTVGETHFFRDSAQFDALTTHVLPDLIARKRALAAAVPTSPPLRPQLRLWSVGCASGEEPYSLAMLIHELIPDIARWHILILATDINQESLAQAQEATYSDWSFRETAAKARCALYFTRQGNRYQLRPDIRQMITFAYHNLIEDDFPSVYNNTIAMDLILCRNVTIYFAPPTTRQVVAQFYDALTEEGWLVVGHSEPSLTTYQAFTAHTFPGTLLYQRPPQPALPLDTTAASSPTVPVADPPPSPTATAQALLQEGQAQAAVSALVNQVDALSPTDQAPAYRLLARAYADLGQWAQARQWSRQALALDSLSPDAYYTLALIHEHENEIEAAIANLKKVTYLDRKRPLPYFNLALLYKKTGQIQQAQRALHTLITLLQTWPPHDPIPDTGHYTAARLTAVARQIQTELENSPALHSHPGRWPQ